MAGALRWRTMHAKNILICLMVIYLTTYAENVRAARENPLKDPKICGRPQCDAVISKFGYGDKIYKYDYRFKIRTEFAGSGENTSDLFIKAGLELFFPKPCEGILRINRVQLWETEQNIDDSSTTIERNIYDYYDEVTETNLNSVEEDFSGQHEKSALLEMELKQHLLRFAFHDGHISEVCPRTEELAWALNFKKGILSALQNNQQRFDIDLNTTESDIAGKCNVQYLLESTDNALMTIRKTKDIASCKNRYSTHSMLQAVPYTFRQDTTIWPILNSESYCNLTIDNNIYRTISCYEKHQLIPFSNSSSGATTLTNAKLELLAEEPYTNSEILTNANELIEKRSTLYFDHTPIPKPTHGEIKASRELLKEMCALGLPNIQREFIDVFTNFLQTTKSLDYNALSQLLSRSASICKYGKNHVLESLPYIGSSASYRLMRDQIISNAIPQKLANSWMISLSFTQRPDTETLDTFSSILDFGRQKIDPAYTLGASAVIHNYCVHNADCKLNSKVQHIVNMLETEFLSLFNMFNGERRTHERLTVVLKGLGNIGVISDQFAEQLQDIITESADAPVDIRLQSILVFRRVDCLQHRSFFLSVYANSDINAEVRILSYLQTMRCPNYKSIKQIQKTLEKEEVNQVGSFVWSHLKNLAKSSSPINIEVQGLLLDNVLSDKFKLDVRKFSRNFEHSLFFDDYNFGTTTDMNLIFGTESYLPRMANVNFTAHIFGQSVNLFELSLRCQGFEDLVATVFGPKGPLNREVFQKKMSSINRWLGNQISEDEDGLGSLLDIEELREKRENERSVNETLNPALQAGIDDLGYKLKYDYNHPRAQLGLRVFGNDLWSFKMEGMLEVMAVAKELNPFHQATKVLSGKEVKHSDSRVFLDASYNMPLSVGTSLAIHAFGAASIDLRMSGNLEYMDAASDWNFDVEGRFKPSVSVDIITTMQSDMFYATSGIKVKSNLYTNSEVEAKLKVRGKNLVSLTFNLPQDKNEIFSVRSELLVVKDIGDISQSGIKARRENSTCTWPLLNEAIGLKMCSFYSVPDVSNTTDVIYPSLILSGPLNFSILLTKSDLTAKKYLFEYKWDQNDTESNWSLVYYTPESLIKRLLVANVTSATDAFNASVSLMNGMRMTSAGCNYHKDAENRSLDIFFDTNGNRSFDLNMELKRWQDRTAWVYKPKLLLTVKGVNITGLVGTIRMNNKKGISQNDIELSLETKKLQAIIRGNIVKSEITTSTNMTINYRFQANKIETINVEGKLINSGDKSKTEYRGNIKLKTTAYPKLNFASNATWLSVQGHTEGIVTYNNNPANLEDVQFTSLVRLIFARSQSEDHIWAGTNERTRASFEVNIPKSKIDFRVLVKHEERTKNGTEHNIILGLRYAPEKEATGIFSIHLPRRNLFAFDAYTNITIPEFNFCEARLKVTEIAVKDYMMNFNGSWFTGHNIVIKGNYKDRGSHVQALHHLKLIIESPSFQSTSLNIVYRRNQLIMFLDAQGKYGLDPYGITTQYSTNIDNRSTNAELRLKIREKLYSFNTKYLSEQPKLLQVELHMDKLRDIHIKIGILTLEQRKEVTLELKWDANRDPSQRLGFLAEYNNPSNGKYNGNAMITYPERTISCGFETFTGGPKYFGTVRATWSVNEILVFNYDIGILPGIDINNWLHVVVTTPFAGWHTNSFKAGIYNVENLLLTNATLLWANDQSLELGYKSDYEIKESIIRFDIGCGVNSTIKDIPTINVMVRHWHNLKRVDTELGLRYTSPNDTLNVYNFKSNWELFQNERFQNLSGIVVLLSPFEGYRKGGLAAKFSLSDQREILGAASLNFDLREFTLAMYGYVKKFTDNMLTVNITTPLEKFRTINGRIGLNEKRRHAVAEISAPTSALGIEALFDIASLMDFDVKLSVATPIETFHRAGLFAKIRSDTVDMRGVMNNITIGFSGVWRKRNATDFEYSYRVYTPLNGFEENGFIVKYIKKDHFVLELHGKLSTYKLGIKINGRPKSKLLNQLGSEKIELEILYDSDFEPTQIYNDTEDYDIDYDEFFSYFMEFELDTIVWPTIDGIVDIQEITDFYLIVANVQLPQGRIDAKNRLYFPDYLNILNVLNLNMPFAIASDVKCIFEYHLDLDFNSFYEKIEVNVLDNQSHLLAVGGEVNYTKIENKLRPRHHAINLRFKTPFSIVPSLEINGELELDINYYKGNISSKTIATFLSVAGGLETDENFLETSIGVLLATHIVPYYQSNMYFKKNFSETNNSIELHFEVVDNTTKNMIQAGCNWQKGLSNIINANGRIHTTLIPINLMEGAVLLTKGKYPQLNIDLVYINKYGQRKAIGTQAIKQADKVNIEIWTPIESYRNISFHSTFVQISSDPNAYEISGRLNRDLVLYDLRGVVQLGNTVPLDMHIHFRPISEGKEGRIALKVINHAISDEKSIQFWASGGDATYEIVGSYEWYKEYGLSFSVDTHSSATELDNINLMAKLQPKGLGHAVGELALKTPWKQLGIETVQLQSEINIRNKGGMIVAKYQFDDNSGSCDCDWSWIFLRDMQLQFDNYITHINAQPRHVQFSTQFLNHEQNFQNLKTNIKMNVDQKWKLAINSTLNYRSTDDLQGEVITELPIPINDIHYLNLRYQGNLISHQGVQTNAFLEMKYKSQEAKKKFNTRLTYRNVTDLQGMGHTEWGTSNNISIIEGDFQILRKQKERREFYAKLITPLYKNESTFFMNGKFDVTVDDYRKLLCSIDYPATRKVVDVDFSFKSASNMYGVFNTTTPFLNASWIKTDFNFSTEGGESYRYIRGSWPRDTAYFKMRNIYASTTAVNNFHGDIEMEVPLATRHKTDVEYTLNGGEDNDNGQVKVVYNENQILMGLYKRSKSRTPTNDKDTTDISLENAVKPLGIHYVHTYSSQKSNEFIDIKHVEVFELNNVENFNLTGELHNYFDAKGQEIKIVAVHPNRTVVFNTVYDDGNERTISRRSKLELSPTVWIAYNFKMENFTKADNDSQSFVIEVSYPRRTLTTEGWYWYSYSSEEQFQSNVCFKWTNDNDDSVYQKELKTGLVWQEQRPLHEGDRAHQNFLFKLEHPNLEKAVLMHGTYYRSLVELMRINLTIDYSNDPNHLIKLGILLKDLFPNLGYTNYTMEMFASHEASELDCLFYGSAAALPFYYRTESYAYYKRGYYPERHGKLLALVDLNRKEVEYERNSPKHAVRLWIVPNFKYPVYGLNATVWNTPDTNTTGYIYVDLHKKWARMEVNLTDDASQNLQMVGTIPDKRSGYLEIWRNYEEIRVIDISAYLKMNHSRLITGKLHWRPKIKEELKANIQGFSNAIYNSLSEGIDFWIKSMYTESIEAFGAVWTTVKDYNEPFFDDISELSVLEDDLRILRLFLNQSYEANDFYIKTVVNFTLTIVDELAIRDHIESLPKIFNEIWQAMGDSGKALRNSIMWLIENVKKTYNNIMDTINRFFHGESLQYITNILENGVKKYDKFIKDLHISFIKYVENLWNKFLIMMEKYLKVVLKRLEPHVFSCLSYIETTAWEFFKEVFDFIYQRTNELAESPYFNKVSTFTQDIDRLYKDIKSHDAIRNLKKYLTIAWNFIKEKYFKLVPFGAELNEVISEIWSEIKELEKIEQVQGLLQKYNQILMKLEWVAKEFQLESRLHDLYALIRNQIRNYALNALETDDKYREAKTKFLFDPEVGVIHLEQKLPMSWHAFNETPKFEEIPEYKLLSQVQQLFSRTNTSIVNYIYNLRSQLDPKSWLPPYSARALLIDSRHFHTFDKRFVGLNLKFEGISERRRDMQCTYLLAHDFHQKNFTLILEPSMTTLATDVVAARKLSLVVNSELVEIDLGNDTLTVNGNMRPVLPLQLEDVIIHRNVDVLSIESNAEFNFHCNMQFHLCWIEISGWHFGHTAGLLGTMNNEHFDDFTTPRHINAINEENFTASWSIDKCEPKALRPEPVIPENVIEICRDLFHSGIFSVCNDAIDVSPFYHICLDLSMNANPIKKGHPVVKGACTAALAYIEACNNAQIPLRVPHQCVFCQLTNGSYVSEGKFVEISGNDVPNSSDVVFLVEAKPCNNNLKESKSIMTIVSAIEEQLSASGITSNRYAVMAFGGQSPFDKPRSVVRENRVFVTELSDLEKYFMHIEVHNSTYNDILQAISTASKLNFRAGVAKTFILLSCSSCAANHMRFDYTSILQYMLEEGVILHILADTEFEFERARKLRHFFGIDREMVYTKRYPEGDTAMRQQLHISKNNLGICTPLALETNGSVFSAKKLSAKFPIKRFAMTFAKRVAKSSVPHSNQTCECSGYNSGQSYMMCSPSPYPEEQFDFDNYDLQFNNEDWNDGEQGLDY